MEKIYLRTNWLEYYQLDKALGYFAENTNSCFLPYHNITHACEVLYHALCIAHREGLGTSKHEFDIKCLGIAAIFHNANYGVDIDNPHCSIRCCEKYFDINMTGKDETLKILNNYFWGVKDILAKCLYDANYIYLVDSQFLPQQVLGKFEETKKKMEKLSDIHFFIDRIIDEYENMNYYTGYSYDMWNQYGDSFKDRLLKLKKSLK